MASASDLPESVISPWVEQVGLKPDASDPDDSRHHGFGVGLSLTAGAQDAVRWSHGGRAKEHNLRLLAMARGVSDLRTLDTGRSNALPLAAWEGLLAPAPLDSYYRAAHSLHGITRQLDDGRPRRAPVDVEVVINQLEELADWEPGEREDWGVDGHWPWREAVRDQRRRAEKVRPHNAS